MKHLRLIVLAVTLIVAGATACFKDPTSSLRKGPSYIELTRSSMVLRTGDSLSVQAVVKDAQGNTFDAGDAEWTSSVPAIAAVRKDTSATIPFNAYSVAFVRADGPAGGVSVVTVTSHGLTNQIRVVVLPARLTALATVAVSGTAQADTLLGTPNFAFSAGDTVTFTTVAGGALSFSATASLVSLGPTRPYLISRTASVIRVIARATFYGRPYVTNLTYTGPAEVGAIALDSLQSDSILVAKPRFNGTVTQVGDTMFFNAPAGLTFNTSAPLASVRFDTTTAILLGATSTQLKVISPVTYTGGITIRNVTVGTTAVDSVRTKASYTINQAAFGGTIVTAGRLLDTVKVYGTAITKLDTGSVVVIGGDTAWVVVKYPTPASTTTIDSEFVIAKVPSSTPISVSRVNVGGTIIPALATAGPVNISETPTGEPNEPANDTPGAVTINFLSATAANPFILYGAENSATDFDDLYAFTLTSARTIHVSLQWQGTSSSAGTAADPDFDLYLCDATCSTAVAQSAGSSDPEAFTATNVPAGTYNIYVNAYGTGGATRPYRLVIY